jgi:hypothetical protein
MRSRTKANRFALTYVAFVAGSAVAISLAVIWRFVNTGNIPLSYSAYMRFADITLYLCPPSLMLMETDPVAP